MKKHLRFAALASACVMMLSMVGCGNEPATNSQAPASQEPSSNVEATTQLRGHNSGLTERTAAEGYYVQYLGYEDLGEAIFGPFQHEGSAVRYPASKSTP